MANPDLFTVTEAATVLRIGRTTAYELVRRDFDSGGGEGLGVVRIGAQFRIPRTALERLIGGPLTWPQDEIDDAACEESPTGVVVPLRSTGRSNTASTSDRSRTSRVVSSSMEVESPTLPFTS